MFCKACGTALEARSSGLFCPACVLREMLGSDDEESDTAPVPSASAQEAGLPDAPRYAVQEQIGEGGFARVYWALQLEPVRREVALKVLKPQATTGNVLARFETERQTLARMEHPGIARLWDSGVTRQGQPFFAMELIRGEPITAYCQRLSLPMRDRLEIFCDVCDAVQHAHEKGVLHRDLKPSNILVAGQDAGREVKIIDFGIAKALEVTPDTGKMEAMTALHQAVGTPGYMSPEQSVWGAHSVDVRSDLYALGVVLYELVTGMTPLQVERRSDEHARQRPYARRIKPPSHLEALASAKPMERRDVDAMTLKALCEESARRYASAAAFAEDVKRHLACQPVLAGELSWTYVLAKFARRHFPLVVASSLAVVAVVAGLAMSTALYVREQSARSRAEQAQVEVQAREVDLRRSLSRAAFDAAQTAKQEGDFQGAVAYLTHALRHDGSFEAAAVDLQTLLSQEESPQPTEAAIPLDPTWGAVMDGAVSATGREIAAWFEQAEGQQKLMLFAHRDHAWQQHPLPFEGKVAKLCLSPSGDALLYADSERTVRLLRTNQPKQILQWEAPHPITSVALTIANGSGTLGCSDGSIWTFSMGTGTTGRRVSRLSAEVSHLALGQGDSWVIAGTRKGEVWLLDIHNSKPSKLLLSLPAAISCMATPTRPTLLAVGDEQGHIACSRPESVVLPVTQVFQGSVTAIALAGQGTSVVCAGGSKEPAVRWLDLANKAELAATLESPGIVRQVWPDRTGEACLIVSADSSVRLWQKHQAHAHSLRKPQRSRYVAMSNAGQCMVVQRDLGTALEALKVTQHPMLNMVLEMRRPPPDKQALTNALAFSAFADELIAINHAGFAVIWDMATAKAAGHARWRGTTLDLQATREKGEFLAAAADGALMRVVTAGEAPSALVAATPGASWAMASLSPDALAAVWAAPGARVRDPHRVRIWWAADATVQEMEADRLTTVAVHGGTKRIALGLGNGHVRLVSAKEDRLAYLPLHQTRVTSVEFSPDGKRLVTGSTDGTAAVWTVPELKPVTDYISITGEVKHVTFSGDGRRFAASTEATAVVVDVDARAILGRPLHRRRLGGAVALNADGTRLAVAATTGEIHSYMVAPAPRQPVPGWFLTLADNYVSRKVTSSGAVEQLDHPGLTQLKGMIPASGNAQEWQSMASWLFRHSGLRTMTPWKPLTLEEYLQAVASRQPPGRDDELRRLQPMRYRAVAPADSSKNPPPPL
jgi:WD40 repeat protein